MRILKVDWKKPLFRSEDVQRWLLLRLEAHKDKQGIAAFEKATQEKMRKAREAGRYGWWNPAVCTVEVLNGNLQRAILDKDYVSIGNYAMMLWNRTHRSETK